MRQIKAATLLFWHVTTMIDQRFLDATSRALPRYTSYPTAPFPSGGIGPEEYAVWLSSLAGSRAPISLYLHVPFCRAICFYCGCSTKASLRDEPLAAYADALAKEVELVASQTGRLPVSHIHWGGGTPSLLPERAFVALLERLHNLFDLDARSEHAIELDPRHVDAVLAKRLAAHGITRASLGVQDLDPDVQIKIGRRQTPTTVADAADQLRAAGIDDLNFDLMYGLPGQTVASLARTVEQVLLLGPNRIAVFGYAHVPDLRANQTRIAAADLPSGPQRHELAEIARDLILAAGYVAVGIDHFAWPTDRLARAHSERALRRNFQGYTTDQADHTIGLGASAIGRIPLGFVQNAADAATWRTVVESGRFATVRGRRLTLSDRLRAEVIEKLLCYFEVDLGAVAARHGRNIAFFDADIQKLEPFIQGGFVREKNGHVRITADGPFMARVVASLFDEHIVSKQPALVA